MVSRLPPLSALPFAIACVAALADRVAGAPCPNYPYPSISGTCVGDGFCGLIEPEATAAGPVDDPGPLLSESPDPVAFSHGATAGSGDLYSIVETSVGAGRSSIDATASARPSATSGAGAASQGARAGSPRAGPGPAPWRGSTSRDRRYRGARAPSRTRTGSP